MTTEPNDFFEEDEPIEKLRAAYAAGKKGRTARPTTERTVSTWSGDAKFTSRTSSVPDSHRVTQWTPVETEDAVPA